MCGLFMILIITLLPPTELIKIHHRKGGMSSETQVEVFQELGEVGIVLLDLFHNFAG